MPFVEADVQARIEKLNKIIGLKVSALNERDELNKLLDELKSEAIPEQQKPDKNLDGTPKIDTDGKPVMITIPAVDAVFGKKMDHGSLLTDAERDRRADDHMAKADKIIAAIAI